MPPSSSEVIGAVSHPLRRRILRAFVDDTVRCVTTGELASAIEQPVARVGYHVKTLARCELLRFSRDGHRSTAAEDGCSWSLGVEPDWLRVVLDVWTASEPSG